MSAIRRGDLGQLAGAGVATSGSIVGEAGGQIGPGLGEAGQEADSAEVLSVPGRQQCRARSVTEGVTFGGANVVGDTAEARDCVLVVVTEIESAAQILDGL